MVTHLDSNSGHAHEQDRDAVPAPGGTPPERPGDTDVFEYEDYRAFMRDRFAELQFRKPDFSQRGLARKAGIANPGFFNEVIRGRRRLSPAAAAKMAVGLELSPMETEYFTSLVDYTEARDPVARLRAGRRMLALKNRRIYHTIRGMQSHSDILRQILEVLEKDWVLQAAGLWGDPDTGEVRESGLDPMSESTLRGILEKLVCLRGQAATDPQSVQFSLLVAPRTDTPPA